MLISRVCVQGPNSICHPLLFSPILAAKRLHTLELVHPKAIGEWKKNVNITLEFEEAVKVLEEHIEILKQNLLFLMAECKPERKMTQIVTIKRELDKAVQEKMKLSQIYYHHNNNGVAVPTARTA